MVLGRVPQEALEEAPEAAAAAVAGEPALGAPTAT
jgi:hypothetical protein